MFTVVGAGFGVYGYLPALIETFGEAVILPRDYEAVVMARPELERYRARIHWAADIAAALAGATGAVIAVRPASQPEVLARCCAAANIERVVLEKPVAVDPARAAQVLQALERSGKRYRIGYTVLHTPWGRDLDWPRQGSDTVHIEWTFMAHHFARDLPTWKRAHSQGGGALRFYGIHLLALLARAGYREAAESTLDGAQRDEPSQWRARFVAAGLPECRVLIDSRAATTGFTISRQGGPLLALRDPFDAPAGAADADGDRRIPVLASLLESFATPDDACYGLYERTNALWTAVESATTMARAVR